jgi:hypothetical protein
MHSQAPPYSIDAVAVLNPIVDTVAVLQPMAAPGTILVVPGFKTQNNSSSTRCNEDAWYSHIRDNLLVSTGLAGFFLK